MTGEWQRATQVRSFSWDSEGRLVSADGALGTRTYGYNGLGARVSETGGAVARSFFRDGTGAGSFRYTPSLSVRAHGASSSRFAHTGLKNTDAQTGASATVEASLEFDAFGGLTGLSGSWQGNYGYAGGFGYHAEATGLKQVGHRYYDPDLGRFLSRDPIQDGPNWYAYCLNDPVNGVDPDGREIVTIIAVGLAVIAVAGLVALAVRGTELINRGRSNRFQPASPNVLNDFSRWQESTDELLQETKELAEDNYKDLYIVGPGKEVGKQVLSDAWILGYEGGKAFFDLFKFNFARNPGAR